MNKARFISILIIAFFLLNSLAWAGGKKASSASPAGKIQKYSEGDFFKLFLTLGNTQAAIDQLGPPKAVTIFNEVDLWYYKISVTTAGGEVLNPVLHMVDGRPQTLSYLMLTEMDEKILIAKARRKALAKSRSKKASAKYSVVQFESLVKFRTPQEVFKLLGKPNSKSKHQGKDVWKYNKIMESEGKLWNQNLLFDFGRVNYIWSD